MTRSTTTTTVAPNLRARTDIIHAVTWARHHEQPLFVAAVVLVVAAFVVQWRVQRWQRLRKSIRDGISEPFATALACPVHVKKCRISDRRVTLMRLHWEPRGRENSAAVAGLQAVIEGRMGGPVSLDWHLPSRTVTITAKRAPKAVESEDDRLISRAQIVVRQLLGQEAVIIDPVVDLDGKFKSFAVTHCAIKDSAPTFRAEVDSTMQAKLGQRLHSQWNPAGDHVIWRRAKDFSTRIPHPADLLPGCLALPFAADINGNPVAWDLNSAAPHAVVAGSTGAGKSVALRNLVMEATRRGVEVHICDVKRVSLLGLRGHPGVTVHATKIDDIAKAILDVHAEVDRRYIAMDEDNLDTEQMAPLILLVEEAWTTITRLRAAHKKEGGKNEHPAVEAFQDIARLGRECHVHLLAAFQRTDARLFEGETRSNFSCRILLGDADRIARDMLSITKTVSDPARGRAIANVGSGQVECQVYWVPDPRNADKLSPDDKAIIDGLRPAPAVRTIYPDRPVTPQPVTAPQVVAAPQLRIVTADVNEPEVVPAPPATRHCTACDQPHPVTDFGNSGSRCLMSERKRQAKMREARRNTTV